MSNILDFKNTIRIAPVTCTLCWCWIMFK